MSPESSIRARKGFGMVEILLPFGDGAARMANAEEQALVQQLVPHSAIEGFDVTVLHRLMLAQ